MKSNTKKGIVAGFIISVIALLLVYKNKTKKTSLTPEGLIVDEGILDEIVNVDVFKKYDNKLVVDSDGYWILIKDGKLLTTKDVNSLNEWRKQNPEISQEINLVFPIWKVLANDTNTGSF